MNRIESNLNEEHNNNFFSVILAFVEPIDNTKGEFRLRWFTPTVEVSLCGHATLATGFIFLQKKKKN